MCVSCGCGQLEDNHGDPRNITLRALQQAAQAAGQDVRKVAQNINDATASIDR